MQQPKPETIALDYVVITQELSRRSPRSANFPAENQAMRVLAQQMVNATELMLQNLVEIALELCQAHSAGVSLLETIDGKEVFGSHQLAGKLSQFAVDTIPRDFSPCGVCLDRRTPQLFSYPERYFTYLQEPQIPIVEALLLPLIAEDRPLGAIWLMAHDEKRHFDAEDVRLMTSLADLTAAALLMKGRQTQELLSANAQLETAKERNRVALEAAQMATWDWNLSANTVTWNEQHYRLLGLEPAPGEEPADLFARSVHPDDLTWVCQQLESAIAQNSIYQTEFRIIRADTGEIRWMSGYGRVVETQNGKATRMAGVMYDITHRHQIAAALRESEAQFRAIANLVPDMLWRNDTSGESVWYNQRWLDYTGKTPREARDYGWLDVIHPSDRASSLANFQKAINERRPWQQEQRIRGKDGNYRWFQVQANPVFDADGQITQWFGAAIDIHEQRMAREALSESEERLRATIENLPGGAAFVVDRDLRYLLAEGEALAQAGFTSADFVGQTIFEVLPPELVPSAEAFYRQGLAGETFEAEHNISDRTYVSRGTPLRSAKGEIYAVLAISYDITDRKQAEVALCASEAKYRSLFELLDQGFCIFELIDNETQTAIDYRFLEVNQVFERQTGLANAVGKLGSEIAPNTERYWLEAYEKVARTGEPLRIENYNEDTERWYLVYASRIGGAGSRQVCTVFDDITNRKRAEAQLRRAAEMDAFRVRLSDALRPLSDAVEIQATVTRTTMNLFGTDRCYYCEIIDGDIIIRRDAAREDLPTVVGVYPLENSPIFKAMLDAGQPFAVEDVHTTDILGENLRQACFQLQIISFIIVPVIKQGEPVGILSINQTTPRNWTAFEVDLAEEIAERTWATIERTRAEANLREAELQRVREEAARQQERQRAETLAELDRAKTTFFSNVSHEFRTPLTLLLSPLQEMLSDRTLPSAHQERLELAHRNSLRLLKLVNTLLDFSRIESGRMEAVYEPTDLSAFTSELASVFRSAIEQAGLRFLVDCLPLPEAVYVDREMWEKIVLNLISNAFKFTLAGEIAVRLHPVNSHVVLEVQDTGSGIAPEDVPHIFERFYQVRGTQARLGKAHAARTDEGSGIGLALVHELVQLQGGTINVSSTLGEGSCFTIALPFGTEHLPQERLKASRTLTSSAIGAVPYVQEAELWQASEREMPANARVLVVDDNTDMREYLTRILSEHLEVEAVADGAAALLTAQKRVPDLILSDVMMPGLDGFELLQALRADTRTKEIPIILLSARAGEEAIVEGLEAGADDYLIKPFSAAELVSRVNAHLQMAQLRSQSLRQERTLNQRKDELLSVVSHELNTPLVSILGWTRLLRANPPSLSMLAKALDIIERNATLQAKLVQDLLDISRIEAGKLRLNLEPVELASVINNAIATVSQIAQAKAIDLIWQPTIAPDETNSLVVMGDRDRLEQVICNLLTNAIKFTPQSGSVTVELLADTACVQIRVTDTGIGIAADFLPYVFDRFRQAATDTAKGLGLGLAIARHLVELHDGTIEAQSDGVGHGATFIVRLPRVQ